MTNEKLEVTNKLIEYWSTHVLTGQPLFDYEFPDIYLLQEDFSKSLCIEISIAGIVAVWEKYSETLEAGWIMINDNAYRDCRDNVLIALNGITNEDNYNRTVELYKDKLCIPGKPICPDWEITDELQLLRYVMYKPENRELAFYYDDLPAYYGATRLERALLEYKGRISFPELNGTDRYDAVLFSFFSNNDPFSDDAPTLDLDLVQSVNTFGYNKL